jgi:hypothetical protein
MLYANNNFNKYGMTGRKKEMKGKRAENKRSREEGG